MSEQMRNIYNEIEEDTQKGKFLTFSLGGGLYGIDIIYVTEIVGMQPITNMPELPSFVKGIINLRGKIISVMDARLRFNKEAKAYNDRTCIIVIDVNAFSIGIIVDEVAEVLTIEDDNIVPPPDLYDSGRKFIKSVGKIGDKVALILDCEKLINEAELEKLSQVSE